MYSLVLMAALSTGGEAPSFFHRHGCHGCWSSCHSCYGGGCYGGCYGGGCYGGGCYGGCYGSGCYGGYGGGCYSSCYGSWGYGCYGGGCYGAGCYGTPYAAPPMMAPSGAPAKPAGESVPAPKKNGQASTSNAARLVVEMPADAKLFVDDQLMKTTAAVRTFNTPILQPGLTYYYILRAEVVRDGKTVQETKRVLVRAGDTVRASFPELGAVARTTPAAETADGGGQ